MTGPMKDAGSLGSVHVGPGLTLAEILGRFIQVDSESAVYDTVTRTVHEVVDAGQTLFVLVENRETTIASRWPNDRASGVEYPPTILEFAVESYTANAPQVIDDRLDVRCTAVSPASTTHIDRARSLIFVPFADRGVLTVMADGPGSFTESDLEEVKQLVACGERTLEHLEAELATLEGVGDILAHDVVAPLQVAIGRLPMAQSTGDSAHFEAIEEALRRLEDLIEGVVTLIRTGEPIHSTDQLELADEAEAAWDLVETGDGTLETPSSTTVNADRNCLRQILENLFRNAVDHAEGHVTVSVGSIETGFYVEDDGPGVAGDRRTEVFETGVSTAADHSGLGLSIVKRLVEAHDWAIEIMAAETGGTRVEIETSA